jgi:plastocyanin
MKTRKNNSDRILKLFVAIFIVSSVFMGCSKSNDTPNPGTNEVFIVDFAFSPSTITVSANTTITWTNKDVAAHTVTSTTGLFDSGSISTNGTYSHLFTTAGSFPYKCTIHPTMTATVIVN